MTPFWIVNFLKEDSCESFFENFWNAYVQNSQQTVAPLKFFHITDGTDDGLTCEGLNEIASKKLTIDETDTKLKLIPAFNSNQGNRINVIFIGDITQDKTIERFHTWAAYLKQQLLIQPWFSINNVAMFGILLRPETIAVDENVMNDRVKGFLNELNTLERMSINTRPFDRVLFIQAPVTTEGRAATIDTINLSAYHIARTNGQCFKDYVIDTQSYFDVNTSAVFYETNVQKGIDAYNLSLIMLQDLVASEDEAFLNVEEARKFVNDNQDYTNSMTPMAMSRFLVSECPKAPAFDILKPTCHPLNFFKIRTVWQEYYNKYIVKLKSDLVNKVQKELLTFEDDYRSVLFARQHQFVTERSDTLQNLVFQMFCDTGSHSRFKHIGLKQSIKVLEYFKIEITNTFKDKKRIEQAFVLPENFEKAITTASTNGRTSKQVLDELTLQLEKLSVYNPARLLRTTLLGILVGILLSIFLSPVALIAIPLIVMADMIVFNSKVKHIESLKDQYVGMRMQEIRERLNEQIHQCIDATQKEIRQYIEWLHDKKLVWLQENLSVLAAPSTQLKINKVFQPLLDEALSDSRWFIPAHDIDLNRRSKDFLKHGTFGQYPLTENVPTTQLNSVENGSPISIFDLVDREKNIVQELVQRLMHQDENVTEGSEEQVDFHKQKSLSNRSMLLLLDVSGSMFGEMESLKQYVKDLESLGEIEWIAFDDKVVSTSRDTNIENLSSGGGTCYIPAIQKAVEWLRSDNYDDIVLLSDGGPFETINDIVSVAQTLNQPLNTIAVGASAAEETLIEIAHQTCGKEITVANFEEIRQAEKWNSDILPRLALLDDGEYSFGELMKHTQIAACAKALQKFTLKQLEDNALSIPKIFSQYICKNGFEEWLYFTSQRNTLTQSAAPQKDRFCFSTANEPDVDKMEQCVSAMCNHANRVMRMDGSDKEPAIIVSLMSLRPLSNIGDLQWASTMKHGDKTINDIETLKNLKQEDYPLQNIYDEEIKSNDLSL